MIKDIKKQFEDKNEDYICLRDFINQSPICKFMGYENDRLIHQFKDYPKKYAGIVIKKNGQKNKWYVSNIQKLEEVLEKKYLPFSLTEREILENYLKEKKKC
jgi:hypothetical protein